MGVRMEIRDTRKGHEAKVLEGDYLDKSGGMFEPIRVFGHRGKRTKILKYALESDSPDNGPAALTELCDAYRPKTGLCQF